VPTPTALHRARLTVVGRLLVILVTVVASALLASACTSAPAAPGPATTAAPAPSTSTTTAPVVVEELAKGTEEAAVDVEVQGPSQVVFRRITIHPGGGTGQHCHAGQLVAVVEQGVLTHYAPTYPGGVHVYRAGETVLEGAGYVHQGKNEGSTDLVLLVTYVIAAGQPLAQTDLNHCDPVVS
jgi:quercetin dioxygenase-like cupin family protein